MTFSRLHKIILLRSPAEPGRAHVETETGPLSLRRMKSADMAARSFKYREKVCGIDGRKLDRPTSSLTADLGPRLRPYLPCPWRIRVCRSFHRSERETAAYRFSTWLPTAGQWCS